MPPPEMMIPDSAVSLVDIIGPATSFATTTVAGTSVSSVMSSVRYGSSETLSSILHAEKPPVMCSGISRAFSDRSSKPDSSSNCPMRMIPEAADVSVSVCRGEENSRKQEKELHFRKVD